MMANRSNAIWMLRKKLLKERSVYLKMYLCIFVLCLLGYNVLSNLCYLFFKKEEVLNIQSIDYLHWVSH